MLQSSNVSDGHWLCTKLDDLDFADDIALVSHSRAQMQHKSVRLNDKANAIEFKLG